MEEKILKFALDNAIKHKGKAQAGSIVPKLLGEDASLREKMKELMPKINKIVKEVNSMSEDEQKGKMKEIDAGYFDDEKAKAEQRKKERKELPELKNAVIGGVITRIPPEPSKYNHIGHALSFLLNYMYAKKYQGKCLIRFEDTNPEKSTQEYADSMGEDVIEYLDIKTESPIFASDDMDKFYAMADQLIDSENAYTCACKSEDISKMRRAMEDCSCRSKAKGEVKADWEKMKKGEFEEGAITLRLKISMQHKNAVMRDPVIFRLCYAPHFRQEDKYKVWPMYDFENAIEDGMMRITHVLRSNEFESRIELQNYIRGLFGLPNPEIRQYARYNVTGAVTKGREIRELIKSGNYIGWDDPRLVTLKALSRRGIVKESLYELARTIGMSKTSSNLDFSVIAAINRRLLDEKAHRYFFIGDSEGVYIEGAPKQELELDLHPHSMKGGRKFKVHDKFLLSKKDLAGINEGELVRLMDCLNFVKKGSGEKAKYLFDSLDLEKYKKAGKKIIHWLPAGDCIEAEIMLPDSSIIKGYAETNITNIEEGSVIQFERFGFSRLDSIDECSNTYRFWFTHD
jgi:glutamyl-tRNA synthetase